MKVASTPSSALREFRGTLKQVEAVLRHEGAVPNPPPDADLPLLLGLRGGAIVLLVGAFEAFLRGVFLERIGHLASRRRRYSFERLPDQMRVQAAWGLLLPAMEGSRDIRGTRAARLPAVQAAAAKVGRMEVDGGAFTDTGSNPSSTTVREMFKRVGVDDIFTIAADRFALAWGSALSSALISDKLDSIVSARHRVAHGSGVLEWSHSDLQDALRFVRHLASTLDAELRIHMGMVGT